MKQFRDTRYYVTETGEIWFHRPYRLRLANKILRNGKPYQQKIHIPEKWNKRKLQVSKSGYNQIVIRYNGQKTNFFIHRMVAELYVPGYFEGAQVDHIDCNKQNNHYTNLQWCTKSYNVAKGFKTTYPLFCNSQHK